MAATTTLPVEFLFTLQASTERTGGVSDGPQGTRVVVRVTGGTFEGPRLRGKVGDGGSDWVTVRADGSFKLDVRIPLLTEDGAQILMTYSGIGQRNDAGEVQLRAAPLFETGDERYTWLNRVQAVSTGSSDSGGVRYEVYALK